MLVTAGLGVLLGWILPSQLYSYVVQQIRAGEWGDVDLHMNSTAPEEPLFNVEDMPDMRDEDDSDSTNQSPMNEGESSAQDNDKEEL